MTAVVSSNKNYFLPWLCCCTQNFTNCLLAIKLDELLCCLFFSPCLEIPVLKQGKQQRIINLDDPLLKGRHFCSLGTLNRLKSKLSNTYTEKLKRETTRTCSWPGFIPYIVTGSISNKWYVFETLDSSCPNIRTQIINHWNLLLFQRWNL